ncbi:MAG: hypothetical protein Q4A15_06045, partial [Prevotellaceae bacterium]|nr:hypothetical protein [Prevotellaceae bacterium]
MANITSAQVKEAIDQLAAMTAAASITPEAVASVMEKLRNLTDAERQQIVEVASAYLTEINTKSQEWLNRLLSTGGPADKIITKNGSNVQSELDTLGTNISELGLTISKITGDSEVTYKYTDSQFAHILYTAATVGQKTTPKTTATDSGVYIIPCCQGMSFDFLARNNSTYPYMIVDDNYIVLAVDNTKNTETEVTSLKITQNEAKFLIVNQLPSGTLTNDKSYVVRGAFDGIVTKSEKDISNINNKIGIHDDRLLALRNKIGGNEIKFVGDGPYFTLGGIYPSQTVGSKLGNPISSTSGYFKIPCYKNAVIDFLCRNNQTYPYFVVGDDDVILEVGNTANTTSVIKSLTIKSDARYLIINHLPYGDLTIKNSYVTIKAVEGSYTSVIDSLVQTENKEVGKEVLSSGYYTGNVGEEAVWHTDVHSKNVKVECDNVAEFVVTTAIGSTLCFFLDKDGIIISKETGTTGETYTNYSVLVPKNANSAIFHCRTEKFSADSFVLSWKISKNLLSETSEQTKELAEDIADINDKLNPLLPLNGRDETVITFNSSTGVLKDTICTNTNGKLDVRASTTKSYCFVYDVNVGDYFEILSRANADYGVYIADKDDNILVTKWISNTPTTPIYIEIIDKNAYKIIVNNVGGNDYFSGAYMKVNAKASIENRVSALEKGNATRHNAVTNEVIYVEVNGIKPVTDDFLNQVKNYSPAKSYTHPCLFNAPAGEGKCKLVIMCPGGGGTYNGWFDYPRTTIEGNPSKFGPTLLQLGYAVLVIQGWSLEWARDLYDGATTITGTKPSCNWMAVEEARKAYDYIIEKYPWIDKDGVFLHGESQGGGMAENIAELSGIPVRGTVLDVPVISLQYQQWNIAKDRLQR